MGMYVEVNAILSHVVGDRKLEATREEVDKMTDNLEKNNLCVDRLDYDGMIALTSTSFDAFDDFVNAAQETVRDCPDLDIEAYFDFDADECSCKVVVNSEGAFRYEEVKTYDGPYKICDPLEKGA